jgi:hypothetical protein
MQHGLRRRDRVFHDKQVDSRTESAHVHMVLGVSSSEIKCATYEQESDESTWRSRTKSSFDDVYLLHRHLPSDSQNRPQAPSPTSSPPPSQLPTIHRTTRRSQSIPVGKDSALAESSAVVITDAVTQRV